MDAKYFITLTFLSMFLIKFNLSSDNGWRLCTFGSSRCLCSRNGTSIRVNCSYRGLKESPIFPANVVWIKLTGNYITKMPATFPKKVRYIDFSRNNISNLKKNHFKGLSKLEYLNLEQNMIKLKKSDLFPGLFNHLHSLRELNMKHNSNVSFERGIYDYLLSGLSTLQVLKIDAPKSTSFGEQIKSLKNLRHLDLSGITGYCNLAIVRKNTFLNLPYLTSLDISACSIKHVQKGAFGFLKFLKRFDISHNRELGFASLPNITHNLNRTEIQFFYADDVNCLTGLGKILKINHIINLQNTSIIEMSFARNRMELLENNIYLHFPKYLQKLSAANNKLTTGLFLFQFNQLKNLKMYNMSLNLKPPPYEEAINDRCREKEDYPLMRKQRSVNEKLESLNKVLGQADEKRPSLSKASPSSVTKLSSIRKLSTRAVKTQGNLKFYFPFIPPNLEIVYLNSSRLYAEIPQVTIPRNKIREIYAQNNFFYSLKGPFSGSLENLMVVDFSNNFCNYISPLFLRFAKNLRFLNLAQNSLGPTLMKDSRGRIFEKQENLEILDLSQNDIYFLPNSIFKCLKKMKRLIMRNNQISRLDFGVGHMRDLHIIDLSDNKIGSLTEDTMDVMLSLFTSSNTSIDLNGNSLLCTCQNVLFLKWMENNKQHFRNLQDYACSELNPTGFDFKNIEKSVDFLVRSCRSYLVWYIAASTSFSCIVCIVIAFIVKRNIWTIRYLIHKSKQKVNIRRYTAINDQHHRVYYEYDVFVSYVGRDRAFVMDKMVKELQDTSGLRLFIRDLDFEPGLAKVDNIMNGLRNSRRTICVVTKAYLESKWRDYELNIAKVEGIKDRGSLNYVHLILMPEVTQIGDIKKIMDLVKNNYYIEYPDDCRLYSEFWRKLTSIINTDIGY